MCLVMGSIFFSLYVHLSRKTLILFAKLRQRIFTSDWPKSILLE